MSSSSCLSGKHGTVFNDLEEGSHGIDLETRSFMYKKTRKHLGPFVIRVPLFRASGEATVSRNNVTLHFNTSEPASFLCKMDHLPWETCELISHCCIVHHVCSPSQSACSCILNCMLSLSCVKVYVSLYVSYLKLHFYILTCFCGCLR